MDPQLVMLCKSSSLSMCQPWSSKSDMFLNQIESQRTSLSKIDVLFHSRIERASGHLRVICSSIRLRGHHHQWVMYSTIELRGQYQYKSDICSTIKLLSWCACTYIVMWVCMYLPMLLCGCACTHRVQTHMLASSWQCCNVAVFQMSNLVDVLWCTCMYKSYV